MLKKVALGFSVLMAVASSAMAALDAQTLTDIQSGIAGADANYFTIGGSILVVLAGIWGFRLVVRLVK